MLCFHEEGLARAARGKLTLATVCEKPKPSVSGNCDHEALEGIRMEDEKPM